ARHRAPDRDDRRRRRLDGFARDRCALDLLPIPLGDLVDDALDPGNALLHDTLLTHGQGGVVLRHRWRWQRLVVRFDVLDDAGHGDGHAVGEAGVRRWRQLVLRTQCDTVLFEKLTDIEGRGDL